MAGRCVMAVILAEAGDSHGDLFIDSVDISAQ